MVGKDQEQGLFSDSFLFIIRIVSAIIMLLAVTQQRVFWSFFWLIVFIVSELLGRKEGVIKGLPKSFNNSYANLLLNSATCFATFVILLTKQAIPEVLSGMFITVIIITFVFLMEGIMKTDKIYQRREVSGIVIFLFLFLACYFFVSSYIFIILSAIYLSLALLLSSKYIHEVRRTEVKKRISQEVELYKELEKAKSRSRKKKK